MFVLLEFMAHKHCEDYNYADFSALLMEEDLMCPFSDYFRHE
jgi:hypothetical protein